MQLFKELLDDVRGYDALVYSTILNSLHPNMRSLPASNEYLMGRIHEVFEHTLIDSLTRLEEVGYIKILSWFGKRQILVYKKVNEMGEYLDIVFEDDKLQSPNDKVYLSYLFDRLKSEPVIDAESTFHVLGTSIKFDDSFKDWFSNFNHYGISLTSEGTFYTELNLPIEKKKQREISSNYFHLTFSEKRG